MSWAIWITGPPGCGKSTVARATAERLRALGEPALVLDLDEARKLLTPAPTYSPRERELVYRSLAYVAKILVDSGVPVIIDATAHRRTWRDLARATIWRFAEVQLLCPQALCIERERSREPGHAPRLIYGRAGAATHAVPGVDVPYEAALNPELVVNTADVSPEAAATQIAALALGFAPPQPRATEAPTPGWVIWITGLPGSGKTTLAREVAGACALRRVAVKVLDFAELRHFVSAGAPVSAAENDVLHRALVYAAGRLTGAGISVIIDAIAVRRAWRQLARERITHFAEVELVCPAEVCFERERNVRWGLAPCAYGGGPKILDVEGPGALLEWEHALAPELRIRTDRQDVWSSVDAVVQLAERLQRATLAVDPRHRKGESVMHVRDLMTRALITVSPRTSVTEAKALMEKERVRHLLVIEGEKLAGLVTDRDIRLNLASPATTLSVWELNYLLARLTVDEVMTKSLIVVDPDRDVRDAAHIMLEHKIGALPVLEGERLVGILTETDLVRAFAQSAEPATVARAR